MANQKVAFVIDGLQMGGAEKFLINNVNYLFRNGFELLVILLSEEKTLLDELDAGVPVETITRRSKYDLFICKRIKKAIESRGIRKVVCINTYAFFLTKLGFLRDKHTRFYLSLHTTTPASMKSFLKNVIYTRFINSRDLVIYVCNNQKEYLRRKYHIRPRYELVIYNGIDTSFFDPCLFSAEEISTLRKKLQLTENDKVIVKVARLYMEKGHKDAIDALKILHDRNEVTPYLLFVGGGDKVFVERLQQYAEDNGLKKFVLFAGNQKDVRKFYLISDVFTLTSFSETFSLAALEAMSFGLPCSLTDIGGANEMILEGKTGYLSKARCPSSIAQTWEKLLQTNLKGNGIRNFVVSEFSSEKMLQTYMKVLGNNN